MPGTNYPGGGYPGQEYLTTETPAPPVPVVGPTSPVTTAGIVRVAMPGTMPVPSRQIQPAPTAVLPSSGGIFERYSGIRGSLRKRGRVVIEGSSDVVAASPQCSGQGSINIFTSEAITAVGVWRGPRAQISATGVLDIRLLEEEELILLDIL